MKAVLAFLILALHAQAVCAETTASGQIAEGTIDWKIEDGVLILSGQGAIPTYESSQISPGQFQTNAPWGGYASQISSIKISDGITDIGQYAFNGIPATSVDLGQSVQVIGQYAFSGAAFSSVVVPSSVTTIAEGAFGENANLTSLTIPDTTAIDRYGFSNVSNVTFYCNGNTAACDANLHVYYPDVYSQAVPANQQDSTNFGHHEHQRHRIYTVEEATRLSKPTGNTFMLRYK